MAVTPSDAETTPPITPLPLFPPEEIYINGLQKVSFIDYPGHIVATIFFGGCNFRCPYCHNSGLVHNIGLPRIPVEELYEHLENRRGKLDGICITGGEPTLNPHLPTIIEGVKERGFKVKLDTNGTNPRMLGDLLSRGMVDYVAMDIKAPPERYGEVVRRPVRIDAIQRSIDLIRTTAPDYEFRTTIVRDLITARDLQKIGEWLHGSKRYALQQFRPTNTLDPSYRHKKAYTLEEMEEFAEMLRPHFEEVVVRGK